MITLLFGENEYECVRQLEVLVSEAEVTTIDASEPDSLDQVAPLVQGASLFHQDNVVVVKYLPDLIGPIEQLVKICSLVPDSSHLIVFLAGNSPSSKAVKKLAPLVDKKIESKVLDLAGLKKWVGEYIKQIDGLIDSKTTEYLIDLVGNNQFNLSRELDKLVSFARQISIESIDEVAVASEQATIFQMLDAMTSGQNKRAQELFRSLLNQGQDTKYVMSMICWQMHMLIIAALGKENLSATARETGTSSFVLNKAARTARRLSKQRLIELNQAIIDADITSRSQSIDPIRAVEQLINKVAFTATS